MSRLGWHRDRRRAGLPDEMRDPVRRSNGASGRQPQKGGGPVRIPLLLFCMAMAAAGGWIIGDDQLRGRVGDWWDRQSTSWTATAPPAAPPSASSLPLTATPQPLPAAALPAQAMPQAERTPKPTAVPPTATPLPTPTPTPTATPLPTPTPTPTPIVPPHMRHMEYKQYMLELINQERERAGVAQVVLGTNNAAQLHAESSLENCVASHWGADGLKPYMRYSLAGGYQSNGENGRGLDYCYTFRDFVRGLADMRTEVREAVSSWMGSPGHRRNILEPTHRKVNIGLAWDRYNINAVQHFEGDYVEYATLPTISSEGHLALEGIFKNGATAQGEQDLGIQVFYDPPPYPLTRGQLARTYCYNNGVKVAALRPLLQPGWSYPTNQFITVASSACPDPYDVSPEARPPQSADEAHLLYRSAVLASSAPRPPFIVPWITARTWHTSTMGFTVRADLSKVVGKYGPGVYTILVWARLMGEDNVVSEYSIFHEITPPGTYDWP